MHTAPVSFFDYKEQFPTVLNQPLIKREKQCGSTWARLPLQANEGGTVIHYAATINLREARIFNDDRKRIIYRKFLFLRLFGQIFSSVCRLICDVWLNIKHFFLILIEPSKWKHHLERTCSAFLDIARTLIYTSLLLTIALVALIVGPIFPVLLYTFRSTTETIQNHLNWRVQSVHFWEEVDSSFRSVTIPELIKQGKIFLKKDDTPADEALSTGLKLFCRGAFSEGDGTFGRKFYRSHALPKEEVSE